MNEDNFQESGDSTQDTFVYPEKTVNAVPLPPKILMDMNPAVLEGHTLDNRFLIIRDLSKNNSADRGGIGLVYLAEDLKLLSKKVVIKILQEAAAKDEDLARKFMHEKEALIRLDHHPNVVRILDSGKLSDGNPYIVMEYIHGYSLRLVLTEHSQLSFDFCAHIIESITNALFAAHSKNILHRDIKPENIMLTPQEESFDHVRLIDFGIARVGNSRLAPATEIERGIGTVLYIAPEQLAGQIDQSPAGDIYSCAVVAYEMLTGHLPFDPHTMVEMFLLQEKGVKKLPRDIRPEIPDASQRLILQALSFNPKNRPQNIRLFGRSLADSLRRVGDTQPNYKQYRQSVDIPIDTSENHLEGESRVTYSDSQSDLTIKNDSLNNSIVTEIRLPIHSAADANQTEQASNRSTAESNKTGKSSKKLMWYGLGGSVVVFGLLGVFLISGVGLWYMFGNSAANNPVNTNNTVNSNAEPPPALPLRQVSYYLNVQKMRDGKPYEEPFRATGREIFESGYKFKMVFNSSEDGYLYLFNEGKNKNGETQYYILFPTSEQKDSEKITAENAIETGYQVFGGGKGTEIIWLIWTKKEEAELRAIKQLALDSAGGALEDQILSGRLAVFLQQYNASRLETINDSENQTTTIGSRSDTIIHRFTLEHK